VQPIKMGVAHQTAMREITLNHTDYDNALSGLGVSWGFHFTGLHPVWIYAALSGQSSQEGTRFSPEGATYINDRRSPSNGRSPSTDHDNALSGLKVSWGFRFTGLHPVWIYAALSGPSSHEGTRSSPEGAEYTNHGRSLSTDHDHALSGLGVSWGFHFTGLHPVWIYAALSGQSSQEGTRFSPEGATYINDRRSPSTDHDNALSGLKVSWGFHFTGLHPVWTYVALSGHSSHEGTRSSPEGATYINDGSSPSTDYDNALSGHSSHEGTRFSPEGATYINDRRSPSNGRSPSTDHDNALSGLKVSWCCHITGLHPVWKYVALSGHSSHEGTRSSPERAEYNKDGCSPSIRWVKPIITSPERA